MQAARAMGASVPRMPLRHLLPNVASSAVVISSLLIARMTLFESSLSYLGLGVPPDTPTWGGMIADGRDYISTSWWVVAMPGLALFATVIGVNLIGDRLCNLLDPHSGRLEGWLEPRGDNAMTRPDKIRLGLSTRGIGYHVAAWRHPDVDAAGAESLGFFAENARLAEARKFDFLFLADGLGICAHDNPPGSLSHSHENVELELLTLLSALAALTSRVGLIATGLTSYDQPFYIARRFASLDHISGGRVG